MSALGWNHAACTEVELKQAKKLKTSYGIKQLKLQNAIKQIKYFITIEGHS